MEWLYSHLQGIHLAFGARNIGSNPIHCPNTGDKMPADESSATTLASEQWSKERLVTAGKTAPGGVAKWLGN
jgi:hypothetical protein